MGLEHEIYIRKIETSFCQAGRQVRLKADITKYKFYFTKISHPRFTVTKE